MPNNKIKAIFIGTPDFSVPSLEKLMKDDRFEICGVITQPDKMVGREQIITATPIKVLALAKKIPVYQPEKINTIADKINKLKPDIIIVVAYAQIIPEKILVIPKYGCINVHASLLPKYRGGACVQAPILDGASETGVTVMKMDKGLDTGPILSQKKLIIANDDTAGSLSKKLSLVSAEILLPTLIGFVDGNIIPKNQNEMDASYVKILKKSDGHINWRSSVAQIARFIRAMQPWPGAFSYLNNGPNNTIKIISAENNIIEDQTHQIGEIFLFGNDLAVKCANGALTIAEIQLEGKNKITAQQFINGYNRYLGKMLS